MSGLFQVPRNNSDFTSRIFEFYKSLSWDPAWSFLKYYQNTIRAYCDHIDSGSNGLLAYLGMGMGKSILAASIAVDFLLRGDTGFDGPGVRGKRHASKCIFILTKSLAENMRQAIHKYFDLRKRHLGDSDSLKNIDVDKFIAEKFTFVSMNASNMITQFLRAAAGRGISGQLSAEDSIPGKILLTDTLVIVDEAHNLFRGVTNGSKNSLGFYKTMEASLKKPGHNNYMLFLTGTPINNNPFELVSCFNMLAGEDVLPTDYDDFKESFVNSGLSRTMKNEAHFMDRILGLVAYATHETTPGKAIRGDEDSSTGIEFPTDLGIKVVLCNMSPDQYSLYLMARELEASENANKASRGKTISRKMQLPKSNMTSSYRTKSRQLSNFFEGNLENKDTSLIKNPWTPKYEALLDNVRSHNSDIGTLGLVYSQYVGIGGLGSLAEYLKSNGWKEYSLEYVSSQIETDTIDREQPEDINDAEEAPQATDEIQHHMDDDETAAAAATVTGGRQKSFSHNLTTSKFDKSPPSIRQSSLSEYVREMSGLSNKKIPGVKELTYSPKIQRIFAGIEQSDAFESLKTRDPYAYTPVNTKAYKRLREKKKGGRDDYSDDDYSDYSFLYKGSHDDDQSSDSDDEYSEYSFLYDGGYDGGSKFYNENDKTAPIKASKTFAVIKGGLSPESRKRIESIMQSPDNRHGEVVSLVLVSSVGAEGLDFKAIRHIHILEPYWNYARLAQIQFRGIRNDSHKSLPEPEKNVQTYVYCAIPPQLNELDMPKTVLELNDFEKAHILDIAEISTHKSKTATNSVVIPDTTDVNLLFEAVKNYRIIESFLGPIQRASLTAAIDAMPGARLCSPTNKVLFTKNVSADLKMPDQCVPYKTKKINANVVTLPNGDEYFWVEDINMPMGVRIFDKSHKEITKNDPIFMTIVTLPNVHAMDDLLELV